ncbi:ankyrin repeat protein [Colletotrichum musicola]|uniref:Ankyrin repeat protein n=1 Tax=Colletotrichum musicola TaxID=2175873 RepID=A0A8H6KFY5_9PEZI|nr:ankyrin repeat protein [Colletotrichum musicola]
MDPSGIIGIIGVVGQILAASVKLGLDWKEAPADTKSFIGELEGLSKVLSETLNNVIKNPDFAAAFQGKHSSVMSSDSALLSTSQKELDDLLGKIRKGGDGRRFGWDRMKAAFLNERTQTAVENLQRRCNMLNSMVAIDNIALSANTNLEVRSTRRELAEDRVSDQKRRILDWISSSANFEAQQADNIERRQAGTGQWLLDSQQFRDWITKDRQTLFCPGMPGAGKTMVASIIIERLQQEYRDDKSIGLAYVFYNFRRQHEQSPRDILASLLSQLYRGHVADCKYVEDTYKNHDNGKGPLSTKEIVALIQEISSSFAKVYMVIDALDECQPNNGHRHDLLTAILDLQNTCNVSFLATSRHIPDIERYFEGCSTIEIQATDSDVGECLDGHMSRLPSFVQKSSPLQEEIKTSIVQVVKGMFLLAKLQLESLTGKRSPKAVRAASVKLSTSSGAYDKAYDEAMDRIQGQPEDQGNLARDALSWIVCSRGPLRTIEFQHALAIEQGTEELDEDNIPAIEDIVSVCAGLVTVDEESAIIRLVHYTT